MVGVLDLSPTTGLDRLIALAVADLGDGGGDGLHYVSVEALAEWANCSVKQAAGALERLQESGELVVDPNGGMWFAWDKRRQAA